MQKPNLPGLIEDPAHPEFKHHLIDADGIRWSALFTPEEGELPGPPVALASPPTGTYTWENLGPVPAEFA